jgi:branched-subunit amino acid aminotransferase/4-amino-4-deoxychorismate lyase
LDEESQDLYEGLSSNFCVYDRKLQSLVTAPVGSVLQGTILKMVMAVCDQEKIPVQYKFPNLKNIQDWEGAFISSTSRLILPIETIVLPDGAEVHFQESDTIDRIRTRVLEECKKRVEQLL